MLDSDVLSTYLTDHLAGAEAALGLLDRLGSDPRDELDPQALQREIEADRDVLAGVLEALGSGPSGLKRAAGWVAEKLARPKLPLDEPLGRFEALELLSLGILGKRALWRALATCADADGRLARFDLTDLAARAEAQHAAVERARLAWARRAFTGGSHAA